MVMAKSLDDLCAFLSQSKTDWPIAISELEKLPISKINLEQIPGLLAEIVVRKAITDASKQIRDLTPVPSPKYISDNLLLSQDPATGYLIKNTLLHKLVMQIDYMFHLEENLVLVEVKSGKNDGGKSSPLNKYLDSLHRRVKVFRKLYDPKKIANILAIPEEQAKAESLRKNTFKERGGKIIYFCKSREAFRQEASQALKEFSPSLAKSLISLNNCNYSPNQREYI